MFDLCAVRLKWLIMNERQYFFLREVPQRHREKKLPEATERRSSTDSVVGIYAMVVRH